MKSNKIKSYFPEFFSKPIFVLIFLIASTSHGNYLLNAQESYLQDLEIDSSTKFNDKKSEIPTNPFEIVEMIRRANSLNDATKPSDALDDALESFKMIEEKEKL